mmetsp:Transcript_11506/g.36474  ORF Transcript_11506/g.36474 Transcript_11506/m.36474 type:complete len:351 (+) Transcript_11506:305-1357(+)
MRDADASEHALGELGCALRLDEEGEVDGEVPRLRLYHRDDAPSGGGRVAVDGNLEDARGGREGLLELLAEDGGGALVADSLAHDPRARLNARDDLEATVPPRVGRVRGGEGAQQLVRGSRRRRGEDAEVEDELQHAAAAGRNDQGDHKDRGERRGGSLLKRVGRRCKPRADRLDGRFRAKELNRQQLRRASRRGRLLAIGKVLPPAHQEGGGIERQVALAAACTFAAAQLVRRRVPRLASPSRSCRLAFRRRRLRRACATPTGAPATRTWSAQWRATPGTAGTCAAPAALRRRTLGVEAARRAALTRYGGRRTARRSPSRAARRPCRSTSCARPPRRERSEASGATRRPS